MPESVGYGGGAGLGRAAPPAGFQPGAIQAPARQTTPNHPEMWKTYPTYNKSKRINDNDAALGRIVWATATCPTTRLFLEASLQDSRQTAKTPQSAHGGGPCNTIASKTRAYLAGRPYPHEGPSALVPHPGHARLGDRIILSLVSDNQDNVSAASSNSSRQRKVHRGHHRHGTLA